MIPANVREAMERIAIDNASGIASGLVFDGDFRLVATYAVPILERLESEVKLCDDMRLISKTDPNMEYVIRNTLHGILDGDT